MPLQNRPCKSDLYFHCKEPRKRHSKGVEKQKDVKSGRRRRKARGTLAELCGGDTGSVNSDRRWGAVPRSRAQLRRAACGLMLCGCRLDLGDRLRTRGPAFSSCTGAPQVSWLVLTTRKVWRDQETRPEWGRGWGNALLHVSASAQGLAPSPL